jgi:hypothetical protein
LIRLCSAPPFSRASPGVRRDYQTNYRHPFQLPIFGKTWTKGLVTMFSLVALGASLQAQTPLSAGSAAVDQIAFPGSVQEVAAVQPQSGSAVVARLVQSETAPAALDFSVARKPSATPTPVPKPSPTTSPTATANSAAMLYVAQANNTVGKYNATTGAVINAYFITGLNDAPMALAVSGNNLFVASGGYGTGTVAEYDATTGAAINANFITGLGSSFGLAVSGNKLFVASWGNSMVGVYDATTGAAIHANFITGLANAYGLALSGNKLFVANTNGAMVGEYDATTGAVINANFITELNAPSALLVAPTPTPTPPVAKDFDADGFADLAWENTSTGQCAVWFLKNGVYSSSMNLPTLPPAWHIAGAGDFNGDGFDDLVVENTSTGQRAIWILKDGVYSSTINLPTAPIAWHIENH